MLAQKNDAFEETCETVYKLNQDENVRYLCEMREESFSSIIKLRIYTVSKILYFIFFEKAFIFIISISIKTQARRKTTLWSLILRWKT